MTKREAESEFVPPVEVVLPAQRSVPLVCASPHSGDHYPRAFLAASRLDATTLRRSEDAFVDELFAGAAAIGAPLLKALFPRAYCDPNREPYELDPRMFDRPLPAYANTSSPRVASGLGTIARIVASGQRIYRERLDFADVERRISTLYRPYHQTLARLIEETRAMFGTTILVDCHSMPSIGGPRDSDPGAGRPDIVVGDRFGTSCAPAIAERVVDCFSGLGYRTTRNNPYAGGFTTLHYGRPRDNVHAVQIEINRALYMDEEQIEKSADFNAMKRDIDRLLKELSRFCADNLGALNSGDGPEPTPGTSAARRPDVAPGD